MSYRRCSLTSVYLAFAGVRFVVSLTQEPAASGFLGCLQSYSRREAFRKFVTQNCTQEYLDFWEEVQQFKSITSERTRKDRAMEIYIKYMGAGAPCEIEFDPTAKTKVKKSLLKPTREIFDELQAAAYEHMCSTSYLQFTVKASSIAVPTGSSLIEPQGMREALTAAVRENISHLYFLTRSDHTVNPDSVIVISEVQASCKPQSNNEYLMPLPPELTAKFLSDEMPLAKALFDTARQTANVSLAIALLRLLASCGMGLQFVKFAIDREIAELGLDAWDQGASLAKAYMQELVMLHRGTYLSDTITQLSLEIVRNNVMFDVRSVCNELPYAHHSHHAHNTHG